MEWDTLMESIIQINEGDKPNDRHKCFFCEKEALFTFGVIDNNKTIISNNNKAFILTSVGMCNIHAEAFNSLLSGEHDVNELITVLKNTGQRKINLRR